MRKESHFYFDFRSMRNALELSVLMSAVSSLRLLYRAGKYCSSTSVAPNYGIFKRLARFSRGQYFDTVLAWGNTFLGRDDKLSTNDFGASTGAPG